MKKNLFLLVLAMFTFSCSSGSQTSSSTQNTDNLIDPVAKGNGIWDYSVATDYFYGTQQESPSLWYDLTQQYHAADIQFVFAQFPTLDIPASGILDPNAESAFSLSCPADKESDTEMFNYYALPQLSDSGVSGVSAYLGPCVNGESVTSYYAGFISHVVPLIDVTQAFNAALAAANSQTVIAIADNVASIINSDPNAYGVAFDNEPAINKEGLDTPPTEAGYALEQEFYGEIALQLAKHKKYLFLFDANATAINLYQNGYTVNGTTYKLNNIILSQYLYDIDTTSESYPAGPVSIESYTTLVNKQASNDLSSDNESQPPLRFVLPASATSTIWDYAQGYDMLSAGSINPSKSTYINQTTLTESSPCQTTDATTSGTIDNNVLGLFLCNESGVCPGGLPNPNIATFLSSQNCVNYTNLTPLHEYFTAALASVESAGVTNTRYLGSDLYTWNITAFGEINASKGFFNAWGDSSLYKQTTQVFPQAISPTVWESFIAWNQNLFP